ncbi:MAG: hypothetical protein M3Q00_09985 [Pseudomonadota bacterium]|nr:hypothetical protein [Pseudomonadota bacterium]
MSSDPEDLAFDVYLARGSNLSQRYRIEATDKPGAALDSLILTASRRAKVSMAEMAVAPWYQRWRAPLVVAAVLVLGVGVALRTVLQETKLGAPPPVAPASPAKSIPAPVAPAMESADGKAPAPSEPTGQLMGDPLPMPKDAGAITNNDLRQEKSSQSEEIIVEPEIAPPVPAPPTPVPESAAGGTTTEPESNGPRTPRTGAAMGKDALESQAGSGSPGVVLDHEKSETRLEQDTQPDKSAGELEKSDDELLAPRREQVSPESAEGAAPPAASASPPAMPVEADAPAAQSAPLGAGPRLPQGNLPIVDGKTFRANSAELKRRAEAKEKEEEEMRAAAKIADGAGEAPEPWLRRVAELRRLGRDEEAKAELERFRKRYPDYPAPPER